MRALALACVMVCGVATHATAEIDAEWRDGCPAGNGRVNYVTKPRQLGAVPQLDSTLVPTSVTLSGDSSYFKANAADGVAYARAELYSGTLRGQYDFSFYSSPHPVPRYVEDLAVGFAAAAQSQLAGDGGGSDGPQAASASVAPNVVATLAEVHHVTTQVFPGENASGERDATSVTLIGGISSNSVSDLDRTRLVARAPFDSVLYARDPIGIATEVRLEGVGCYAPFLHLRLSAIREQDTVPGLTADVAALSHHYGVFPETIAGGLYVSSHTAFLFQYGLVYRDYGHTAAEHQVFGNSVVHRFRIAVELSYPAFRVGAHFDTYVGDPLLDGTVLGLYLMGRSSCDD